MIKVIKHGEKTFRVICPMCGCEFEYQLEDLRAGITSESEQIKCPDCGHWICHKKFNEEEKKQPGVFWSNPYGYVPCNGSTPVDPCKDCINKDGLKDAFGNPIPGDSPCDWCMHRMPRFTCSTASTQKERK